MRHGLPSNPKIRKPKEKQEEREKEEAKSKVCHECFEIVEGEEVICPSCGAELTAKKEIIDRDEEIKMMEIEAEKKKHRVIKAWEKTDHVTGKGNSGSLFIVLVTNREKPLFKFCGVGTSKAIKTRAQITMLRAGDVVDIVSTAYGDWVS